MRSTWFYVTTRTYMMSETTSWPSTLSVAGLLPIPWWWYSIEVMPSNLKPSKRYSSIHQRRFDKRNRRTSQLQVHTNTHTRSEKHQAVIYSHNSSCTLSTGDSFPRLRHIHLLIIRAPLCWWWQCQWVKISLTVLWRRCHLSKINLSGWEISGLLYTAKVFRGRHQTKWRGRGQVF